MFFKHKILPDKTREFIRQLKDDLGYLKQDENKLWNYDKSESPEFTDTKTIISSKNKPKKEIKGITDKTELKDDESEQQRNKFIIYVNDCVKNKEVPKSYDLWLTDLMAKSEPSMEMPQPLTLQTEYEQYLARAKKEEIAKAKDI